MGANGANPPDTRTQLFVSNLPFRVRWQDLVSPSFRRLPIAQPKVATRLATIRTKWRPLEAGS